MASSIVSYGGAATSTFLPTPTPFYPFGSNFVKDRINACAPYQVERIKRKLDQKDVEGDKFLEESRRGALFCRSGTWLEMIPTTYDDSIHVHGTHDENSKFSIVEFISVAMSLVSIRGVETKHFICMDPTGKLYATPSSNYSNECVFIEEMMENYYNLYSSCAYSTEDNPWYIELRRSGKPRKGPSTRKRRKASHFLVVHHDFNRLHHPTHPNGNDVSDLVVASLYHKPPTHPMFLPNPSKITPAPAARISRLRAKVQTTVDDEERKQREFEEKKRRREKKKRRREERLQREEQRRRDRKLELSVLRAQELRQSRYNKPKQTPNANPYNSRYSSSTSSNRSPSSNTVNSYNNMDNNNRSGRGNSFNRQISPSRLSYPLSTTTTLSPVYLRNYHHHHSSHIQPVQNRMVRSEYPIQNKNQQEDRRQSYSSIYPVNNQNQKPFLYNSNYQGKS